MFSFLPPFAHAQFARQTSLLQPDTKIGGGDKKSQMIFGKTQWRLRENRNCSRFSWKEAYLSSKRDNYSHATCSKFPAKDRKKSEEEEVIVTKVQRRAFRAKKRWRKQSPIGMLQKPLHPPQSDVLSVTPKEPWNKILGRQRCKSF